MKKQNRKLLESLATLGIVLALMAVAAVIIWPHVSQEVNTWWKPCAVFCKECLR